MEFEMVVISGNLAMQTNSSFAGCQRLKSQKELSSFFSENSNFIMEVGSHLPILAEGVIIISAMKYRLPY